MEDDDDSDYGSSKKKNKKMVKKSKPVRKEKKMPKPRLKATGELCRTKVKSPVNVLYRNPSVGLDRGHTTKTKGSYLLYLEVSLIYY